MSSNQYCWFCIPKLIENITTVADYAKYRAWALSLSGVTTEEVKASSHAWISYALDCNMLIAAEPKKGDVVIDAIESVATDGSFAFTVKVKDVSIGANALEANIRKFFGIEGVEDLSAGDFSSNSVEIKVTEVVDGPPWPRHRGLVPQRASYPP